MPRLFELERTAEPRKRMLETRLDTNFGEESIVVDERSRQSSVVIVDEKLYRLSPPVFDVTANPY